MFLSRFRFGVGGPVNPDLSHPIEYTSPGEGDLVVMEVAK